MNMVEDRDLTQKRTSHFEGLMARCEEGYLCDVCNEEVESITESDLYLRYVLGEVQPEKLLRTRERHIRCNPVVAQFIVDPLFQAVVCDGPFAKTQLDAQFVAQEEKRITRAWLRLQSLPDSGLTIDQYPFPEVIASWNKPKGE